ncbi:IF factor, partial [Heliornis fulica]|nr:IF factor [Heliornis fulica]
KGKGMIGNIYSMGLALQALGATERFYAPREWDCAEAFSVVCSHEYRQPMAVAQVLPALVGKSYLDVASVDCDTSVSQSPGLNTTSELGTAAVLGAAPMEVLYSIVNKLQGRHFNYTTLVRVPVGSTMLQVMEAAEAERPDIFSFQMEQTSWGPMVVSIHGLAANTADRTYWHFLSDENSLQEGVGTYKPQNGTHVQAVFSTY